MSNTLDVLYPGRVTPGDASYPGGSIKNETTPGSSNDGTPLDKEWANDKEGFFQGLILDAGITPSEVTDTATVSQLKNAAKVALGGAGLYQADINYSALRDDYTKGSNGVLYACGIDNGPSSAPIDPVGDASGAWLPLHGTISSYDTILPIGDYASGSFVIPAGRTWSDYEIVTVITNPLTPVSGNCGAAGMATKEVIAEAPTAFIIFVSTTVTENVTMTATSSTGFDITNTANDTIKQIIGYRKAGVA